MDCNAKCWTEMYLEALKTKLSCKFHQFFCTVSSAWNGPICGQFTGVCVCVCVSVYVCSICVLSQFCIPAQRGGRPLQIPLLFSNIYLTFCLSSNLLRWLYDLLETTNFLPIILFSEKKKKWEFIYIKKMFPFIFIRICAVHSSQLYNWNENKRLFFSLFVCRIIYMIFFLSLQMF